MAFVEAGIADRGAEICIKIHQETAAGERAVWQVILGFRKYNRDAPPRKSMDRMMSTTAARRSFALSLISTPDLPILAVRLLRAVVLADNP